MVDLNNIPQALVETRQEEEGRFIFSLWKEPDLYGDYGNSIKGNNFFLYPDSRFYYLIGYKLYSLGYESFDEATVLLYLKDTPTLLNKFEDMGGMNTVNQIKSVIDTDNIDSYYDELVKTNSLIALHNKGFNVLTELHKFKGMTSEDVANYYDYLFNDIFLANSTSIQFEELYVDEDFIDRMDKGLEKGLQFNKFCPILNYLMMGLPKGDLTLVGGHSGSGKTSFAFANMILPIVDAGGKACIISNEQRSDDFKVMLTAMESYNTNNYLGLSRKQVKNGSYTKEQYEQLRKITASTMEKYKDRLTFVRMYDYDLGKIKRTIKRLSKTGTELFMFDTMKAQNLQDTQFWQGLVEDSKELFQLVDKEDVAMITTYQLALHTLDRRYLDASCLSNAKQIKEVYSEMIYFREVWEDEYNGEKFDIKPYVMAKNSSGEFTDNEVEVMLDPSKKYLVIFIDKTRNDEVGTNLVYEFNGAYNVWEEIGFCRVHHGKRY